MNPPELPYHQNLGVFRVGAGGIVIADRCYVDQTNPMLAVRTPARPGLWHAYRRPDPDNANSTLALCAAHEAHLDAAREDGEAIGCFGVDGGCAVIVDAESLADEGFVAEIKQPESFEETMLRDVGCTTFTHMGDGMYNAFGVKRNGRLIAVRLNLSYDETYDVFETPEAAQARAWSERVEGKTELRRYAADATFAEGDVVRHAKFGDGFVARVIEGGKVEIVFREGPRVLVHRR